MGAKHTPGPWRWELNETHKQIALVGGVPAYDLTIISPTRWGMGSATLEIRDTTEEGMNILHKLHDRRDWIASHDGRAHHASWCADVVHPDMCLIAAAPELLEALQSAQMALMGYLHQNEITQSALAKAAAAIAKATRSAA